MTKFLLMLALASPLLFGFVPNEVTCPGPTNISSTKSGGNISFDWDDCPSGCSNYLVQYYRVGDAYQSPEYTTGASAYSFSNLPSGAYKFYFATDCGGSVSGIIIVDEFIYN